MNEIEVRFLEVDVPALEKKLQDLGAEKHFDAVLEEWLFIKPEWKPLHGRVRIRKGPDKVEVAYKETTVDTSKGNKEIEFEMRNVEDAHEFIEKMGLTNPRHQQKRRIAYTLNDVSIDIDFWPQIPPYVEIEAESLEKIEEAAKQLGFEMKDACTLNAYQVIKQIYGIDLKSVTEYMFT